MKTNIETIPEITVVCLRRTGPYGENNRDLVEHLESWTRERDLLEKSVILCAAWGDPARTPPEQCRYDVCLTLEGRAVEPDSGIALERIPGGRYACFRGRHTPAGVQSLWQSSFAALAELGIAPVPTRPVLERYRPELLEQGLCELCIPI